MKRLISLAAALALLLSPAASLGQAIGPSPAPYPQTGTGDFVRATSPTLTTPTLTTPTLTTPTLGVATATSINKVAITAPASSATLTIANGKTLTASNSLTLAGTDSTTMTFPTTTASVARTDAGQTFTGTQIFSGNIQTGGSAQLNLATSGSAGITVNIQKNMTGATSALGVSNAGVIQSDVTSEADFYSTNAGTAASAFTLNTLIHYYAIQNSLGSGSAITNQYGFRADSSLTGASTNYGFFSGIAAGSGRWNFFANGTANNAFGGSTSFGKTTAPSATVDIQGTLAVSTAIPVSSGGTGVTTTADVRALVSPGQMAFTASSVNFNSANTDTAIAITLPTGFTRYIVASVRIMGASASLSTATCGVFTAAAAGGTAVVNGGSAITVTTASDGANNNAQSFSTNNTQTQAYTVAGFPTLYFRVGTAQGSAATGNVAIIITPLP